MSSAKTHQKRTIGSARSVEGVLPYSGGKPTPFHPPPPPFSRNNPAKGIRLDVGKFNEDRTKRCSNSVGQNPRQIADSALQSANIYLPFN